MEKHNMLYNGTKMYFCSFRNLIGGKVRVMLTGGAPLSPQTHEYIRYSYRLTCGTLETYVYARYRYM